MRSQKIVWVGGMAIACAWSTVFPAIVHGTPLEEIEQRGKLQIAVKENVRPLGFRDQTGQLQGLEIDLAHQLAEELLGDRQAVELIPVTNQERLSRLLNEDVDLIVAQMGINASRQRLVHFSDYYYLDGVGFVTRSADINTLAQVNGKRVAVLNHSDTIAAVRNYFPSAILVGVDSYSEALTLLETEQADLFAGDHSILTGWVQEYPNYRLMTAWIDGSGLAIAMPKGRQHQSLHKAIQAIVRQWQESGWLQERIDHWGLP